MNRRLRRAITWLRDREWVATVTTLGSGLAIVTHELDLISDTVEEVGVPDDPIAGIGLLQWGIALATVWFTRRGVNSNSHLEFEKAEAARRAEAA